EDGGDFVVGFAYGVVDGGADEGDVEPVADVVEGSVAAAANQADGWHGGMKILFEDYGVEVGVDVVDADQGFAEGPGEGLGGGDADEKGADEAGAMGDGDGIDVGRVALSLRERVSGIVGRISAGRSLF